MIVRYKTHLNFMCKYGTFKRHKHMTQPYETYISQTHIAYITHIAYDTHILHITHILHMTHILHIHMIHISCVCVHM